MGQTAQISIPSIMDSRTGTVEKINKVRFVSPEGRIPRQGFPVQGRLIAQGCLAAVQAPIHLILSGDQIHRQLRAVRDKLLRNALVDHRLPCRLNPRILFPAVCVSILLRIFSGIIDIFQLNFLIFPAAAASRQPDADRRHSGHHAHHQGGGDSHLACRGSSAEFSHSHHLCL